MINVLISGGISATLTRGGCVIAIIGWLFMFIVLFKQHKKPLLEIFVPTVLVIVPSLLTRYGIIFKVRGAGSEAAKSSAAHLKIWGSLLDYIFHHALPFIIGTGFGIEQTGQILLNQYQLDKPHGHNFVLETWVELGIVGLVLLFTVLICGFGKLLEINANNGKNSPLYFAYSHR